MRPATPEPRIPPSSAMDTLCSRMSLRTAGDRLRPSPDSPASPPSDARALPLPAGETGGATGPDFDTGAPGTGAPGTGAPATATGAGGAPAGPVPGTGAPADLARAAAGAALGAAPTSP